MPRKRRKSSAGMYVVTSKLAQKGSGENIVPQPVMDVYVTKTKLDEPSSSRGSRKQPHYVPTNETSFKTELATIDPNMGFAHLHKCNNSSQTPQTKYGETPVGSFLSYQAPFTESNFSAEADLTVVPRNDVL